MANFIERLFGTEERTGRINNQETKSERSSQAIQDAKARAEASVSGEYIGNLSPDNAHQISTVYTCISILSATIGRLPINIYKTEGIKKTLLKDHPLYNSLRFNPQGYYNSQQWLSLLVSNLYFNGNAYAIIQPTGQLEILHPSLVNNIQEIVLDSGKKELFYYITPPKTEGFIVRSVDVIHFKLLTKDGFKGLNPIESIRSEMNIQYKSEKFVDNFLSKNGNTAKVLKTVGDNAMGATNQKVQELVENFTKKVGMGNNDGVYVLPPYYDLEELSINPEIIQFLQSNQYTTQQIAAVFSVPDHLAGIGGTSGYGKVEEQSLAFKQGISRVLGMMEAELNFKLLGQQERIDGVSIEFDTRPLTSYDLTTHVNAMKILKDAGALSPNEFRAEFNYSYVEAPAMNGYYQQMQYINLLDKPSSGSTESKSVNYLIQG